MFNYWTWPEFYAYIYGSFASTGSSHSGHSRTTRHSYSRSPAISQERSGDRGQSTSRRLNPAFKQFSIENPLFQHFLDDKIGDFERSFAITSAVSVASSPWLNHIRFSSPQGFAASAAVVALISAPLIAYVNTADTYRDLTLFAATGQLHGHQIMGETHN